MARAHSIIALVRRAYLLLVSLLLAAHPLSGCVEESNSGSEADSSTLPGDSGAGAAPDAPREASHARNDGAAQCANPLALEAPRECKKGDLGCYVLSDEWSLLGPTQKPPEATSCTNQNQELFPHECGCPAADAGGTDPDSAAAADAQTEDVAATDAQPAKECGERATCIRESRSTPLGGASEQQNVCRILCLNHDECAGNEVCWAGYCTVPECTRNSDCTRDRCGHCTQVRVSRHLSSIPDAIDISTCAYEGPCGPDSCAGCTEHELYARLGVHFCP